MAVLEQVTRMRQSGMNDSQIINELSQQGISPKEINDAIRQAQIKSAVSGASDMGEELQPSIMAGGEAPSPQQETYAPQYQEQAQQYVPQVQEEYAPQQQQYYQPGAYEQPFMPTTDTDTIIEIAEQVFSDKIKKIQKQLDSTTETATLSHTRFENISERLKKIENIIDRLQISILEKVGSYGQNLESIKKEMSMIEDSFSKMISKPREKHPVSETEESVPKKISKKK